MYVLLMVKTHNKTGLKYYKECMKELSWNKTEIDQNEHQ